MRKLTSEQKRAVQAPQSHLIVSAGAGTGKTTVLVEKYLDHLVAKEARAESLLAITFTERASQEMQDRIRARLESRREEWEETHWDRLNRSLDRSHIGTIHGFCAEVLRDYALEVGIDPKFQVLDEVRAERLRQKAIDQSLLLEKDPLPPHLSTLLSEFPLSRLRQLLGHLLTRRLDADHTLSRWSGLSRKAILGEWGEACEKARRAALLEFLVEPPWTRALLELKSLQGGKALDPGEQRRRSILDTARKLKEAVEGPTPGSLLPVFQDLLKALSDRATGQKANWDEGELSQFRQILKRLQETFKRYKEVLGVTLGVLDERASGVASALGRLYGETVRAYEELKGEEGAVDYDDLLSKTLNLLKQNPSARRELQRRFQKVLVDEFQDTDPLQKEILDLLFDPLRQDAIKKDRAQFLVGDPRQAIYGFRGADVGLFKEVCRRWSPDSAQTGHKTLSENRRSLPAILALVNHVFGGAKKKEASSATEGFGPLRGVRSEAPGGIELLLSRNGAPSQENASRTKTLETEAELIAERILAWVGDDPLYVFDGGGGADSEKVEPRPAAFGDIAILLRAATHLAVYERALQRRGIPFESHTGRGFYRRPEIVDTLSALRWAETQTDEMALAALLRSPLVSLTDNTLFLLTREAPLSEAIHSYDRVSLDDDDREALGRFLEWQEDFCEQLERENLGRALETLWDRSGYKTFVASQPSGQQALSHLKFLRLMAIQFEEEGNTWRDFLPFFDEMARGEAERVQTAIGDASQRVRLMTVHTSKGLEFPVVILPDLGEDPRGRAPSVLVDRQWGIGFQLADENGEWKPTALRNVIAWAEDKRRLSESQRLFYVAATRARDHLALSAPNTEEAKRGSWMALLQAAFPDWETPFGENGEFRLKVVKGDKPPQPRRTKGIQEILSRLKRDFCGEEEALKPPFSLQLLEPIPPVSSRHHTVTDLQQYWTCPRLFYYESLLGLKETQRAPEGSTLPDTEGPRGREVGKWVHLFLERWKRGPFEAIRDIPHPIENERAAYAESLKLLKEFRGTELAQELERVESLAEVPFVLERDGLIIHGRIDRLIQEGNRSFRIVDFKTDRADTADEVARLARRYEFQVGLYALALKEMNFLPSAGMIHFMRPGVTHRFEVDKNFLTRIAQELDETSRGIQAGGFGPDTQNCPACPFPHLCSEARHQV